MSEWKEYKLGDVINLKRGYDLPNSNRQIGKFPIFSSSGITDYHSEYMKEGPGVITGRYGTIGQVFYATDKYWPLNTTLYVQDFKGNHPRFIYYFLKVLNFEQFNDKSAVPGINRNHVHELPVKIPTFIEQTAIASTLSSLDDKIDLLHRQNKTLEALAETLFRQWFIEEAEADWEIEKLGGIADLFNGKSRPQDIGEIPIYGGNGILGYTNKSNYSGRSIIIGRVGAYCGSLYFESKQIWLSDNALIAKAKEEVYTHYLFYLLKNFNLNSMAEGSSHPLLTQTLLKSIEIQKPPLKKIEQFDFQLTDIRSRMDKNFNHINTLTQLRDNLLPKLMSGEVRVKTE